MHAPANLKYTKSDEWFDPASDRAGLSDYAQSQLSDKRIEWNKSFSKR